LDALDKKPQLIVICGPTATGKTNLSVKLAKLLRGEVISADSMQIYKNLNIGTAKITTAEAGGVPHHLIDIIEPNVSYSVAEYIIQAQNTVEEVHKRGYLPILCGGTGLYISSFINGVSFTKEKIDSHIKQRLNQELLELGTETMHAKLKNIDPTYANTLHHNNSTRVLRALEVFEQTGIRMSDHLLTSIPQEKPYDEIVFFLNYRDRNLLYTNINKRVELMLENGILEEAKYVFENRNSFRTASNAIGYKEFFPYLKGEDTLISCVEKLKQATRHYAKRQITWFQSMKDTHIIYVDEEDAFKTCVDTLNHIELIY